MHSHISIEKIWIYHSILGLAIIPWFFLWLMTPATHLVDLYLQLPWVLLCFLIVSGLIFGVGQVCFAYAIETIGIALSFTINLGLGVTIGSLFVVFYKSLFFTVEGFWVSVSVLCIVTGQLINYFSGKRNQMLMQPTLMRYQLGWALAIFTGLTSGLQNITFIIIAFHSTTSIDTNTFWVWPPFLLAAAIPMCLGFLYRIKKKNQLFFNTIKFFTLKNSLLLAVMGFFFTGSLALYSTGMCQFTHKQQIIGWPAFMVSIIIGSQLWGWIFRERGSGHFPRKCSRN